MLTGCRMVKDVSKKLEINNNTCKTEKAIDTHGGFLGDGDYFAKITCSNLEVNQLSSNWKKLPLSEPLTKIKELIQCTGNGCQTFYERYGIPEINNGYYYFYDRHSDSKNQYDDQEINDRSSYNFNLVICDIDNNTIYYYELDT